MSARAISSGTISFGLVSIPVKLFTAASSEQVRFNMLHDKCGGRLKQQLYCPIDDEVVSRSDTVKGYEYAKGQYVRFDKEELKELEADRDSSIQIEEFVPLGSVDFLQVEKSYYLGPDKGGDKAYKLLASAMLDTGKVAVGRWAARGKEQLVMLRPYADGLVFHQLYYPDEVRSFEDVDSGAQVAFADAERELAIKLIEQLSSETFAPEKYEDRFRARVLEAVERKVQGEQVQVAPEAPRAQIIDLFEALKQSLGDQQADPVEKKRAPTHAKTKRAAKEQLRPPAKTRPSTSKKKTKKSSGA